MAKARGCRLAATNNLLESRPRFGGGFFVRPRGAVVKASRFRLILGGCFHPRPLARIPGCHARGLQEQLSPHGVPVFLLTASRSLLGARNMRARIESLRSRGGSRSPTFEPVRKAALFIASRRVRMRLQVHVQHPARTESHSRKL